MSGPRVAVTFINCSHRAETPGPLPLSLLESITGTSACYEECRDKSVFLEKSLAGLDTKFVAHCKVKMQGLLLLSH